MMSNDEEMAVLSLILRQFYGGPQLESLMSRKEYLRIMQLKRHELSAWWAQTKIEASEGDEASKLLVAEYIKIRITS